MRALKKFFLSSAALISRGTRMVTRSGPHGKTGFRLLMYHSVGEPRDDDRLGIRVSPDNFRFQMRFLSDNGYVVVALRDLLGRLDAGLPLPPRTVAITFDDGYRDTLTVAAPIMSEFRFTATVFVCVGYVLKTVRDPAAYWARWEFMSQGDLRSLMALGFDIGLHSLSHIPLARLDFSGARKEIVESRSLLEHWIGAGVSLFSYPHGSFNETVVRLLRENRFSAACSSIRGINDARTDRFRLRRTEIGAADSGRDFSRAMKGLYDGLSFIRQG